jgi:PhnB protein
VQSPLFTYFVPGIIHSNYLILFILQKFKSSMTSTGNVRTSIAPWLSVSSSAQAVEFYASAFGAVETYRLEDPDGNAVVKLSINGAEFWLSDSDNSNRGVLGGGSIRMILTVTDPDAVVEQALKAGATEVFPVGEEHGWRLGRLVDPFGLHWEIGRQTDK